MKFYIIMFLYLLSTFSNVSLGQIWVNLPSPNKNDCSFYKELEEVLKCKKESPYLLDYGLPYCQKFQEMKKNWTGSLKKWVPDTTYCLQSELARDRSNLYPCKLMEDTAFGSHPTCYMRSGFCDFNYFDKQRVINVVAFLDILLSLSQSIAQGLRVKATCDMNLFEGTFHLLDFLFKITRLMDVATKNLAGEIFLNTPNDTEKDNNRYFTVMYYILSTGDTSLDKTTIASYVDMGTVGLLQTMEETFETCKSKFLSFKFCQRLKENNTIAYKGASSGKEFVLALDSKNVKERIKLANLESRKWTQKKE